MSFLDDIAHDIGHTAQSLAETVGSDVQQLEGLVGDLANYGMDVLSVADKIGLAPTSLLKSLVDVLAGDPHGQLLRYTQAPVQWVHGPAGQMSSHWQTMVAHHSGVKQQIDNELSQVFLEGGPYAYSGPAADALYTTHTSYQTYFGMLVDHAQTQQTRYSSLLGQMETSLEQMQSTVYSLPEPVAGVGVIAFDTAAETDPAIQFMLSLIGADASGMVIALPLPGIDIPIETILLAILIILVIILVIVVIFVAVKDAIASHNSQQQATTVPKAASKPQILQLNLPKEPEVTTGQQAAIEDLVRELAQQLGVNPEALQKWLQLIAQALGAGISGEQLKGIIRCLAAKGYLDASMKNAWNSVTDHLTPRDLQGAWGDHNGYDTSADHWGEVNGSLRSLRNYISDLDQKIADFRTSPAKRAFYKGLRDATQKTIDYVTNLINKGKKQGPSTKDWEEPKGRVPFPQDILKTSGCVPA